MEDILKNWDYQENKIDPKSVSHGSHKLIHWICNESKCGHTHKWITQMNDRFKSKSGCPYCSRYKVCPCESFANIIPGFVKYWDWEKNKKINPWTISPKSDKQIHLICKESKCEHVHRWKTRVFHFTKKPICPYCTSGFKVCPCNSFAARHPILLKQWDFERNKISPWEITERSSSRVFWVCPERNCEHPEHIHKWDATVTSRVQGLLKNGNYTGCPWCTGKGMALQFCECNSVAKLYPDLIKEWNPDNKEDPINIPPFSDTKVSWICSDLTCKKKWKARVSHRTRNQTGCPKCSASKGEKEVRRVLDKIYDEKYIEQKSGFKTLGNCSFDFYLINKSIECVIEYDGEQHFMPIEGWGGKAKFLRTFKSDQRKNDFCIKNGIRVLRIPYTMKNQTEELITDFLSKKQPGVTYGDEDMYKTVKKRYDRLKA